MKKIRFRGGIRELSDPAQANTARSFAGINFVIAGLSLALIENINFFLCGNYFNIVQQLPKILVILPL